MRQCKLGTGPACCIGTRGHALPAQPAAAAAAAAAAALSCDLCFSQELHGMLLHFAASHYWCSDVGVGRLLESKHTLQRH
jgi:hypothetical protein